MNLTGENKSAAEDIPVKRLRATLYRGSLPHIPLTAPRVKQKLNQSQTDALTWCYKTLQKHTNTHAQERKTHGERHVSGRSSVGGTSPAERCGRSILLHISHIAATVTAHLARKPELRPPSAGRRWRRAPQ